MRYAIALIAAIFAALPVWAGGLDGVAADVVVLGEQHDNPAHHLVQAEAVAELAPKALVFEMLTEAQAERAVPELRADAVALGKALDWAGSGWPDFEMYAPIFAAAPEARIYGAELPRDVARVALSVGVPHLFGAEAAEYGLTEALEPEELAERLNLQMEAHCGALPLDLLPGMVDLQRLRDAMLARKALTALAETGGPVVVITGNGHARRDWGLPSYIARVAPEVVVYALGQGEDGAVPEGGFDEVLDAPGVDRGDPCEALR
ncbi:MAG: ChaN family lipoprotein [Maritimibacter sp.]